MLNSLVQLIVVPTPLEEYRSGRHCRRLPRREFREEPGADAGHGCPVVLTPFSVRSQEIAAWARKRCGVSKAALPDVRLRILVVDDEPSILDAVATTLRYEGFVVDEARTGREALSSIQLDPPALIVLDVMLPDLDGVELTKRLRSAGNDVPIMLLTARDALEDKVDGLDIGADDYVTKPFVLAELIARVQAILRRSEGEIHAGRLRFADVELDERTHEVSRNGTRVDLTATEFNLLRYFMQHPRTVVSKDQILDDVWHFDFDGDSGIVDTYVSYLRRKLDAQGSPLIHTIRSVGFILRETEGAE